MVGTNWELVAGLKGGPVASTNRGTGAVTVIGVILLLLLKGVTVLLFLTIQEHCCQNVYTVMQCMTQGFSMRWCCSICVIH